MCCPRARRPSENVNFCSDVHEDVIRGAHVEHAGTETCKADPTRGTDALKRDKAELTEALTTEEHQHPANLLVSCSG